MKKLCIVFILLPISKLSCSQAMIALLFGNELTTNRTELGIYVAAQNSFIIGADTYYPNIRFAIGAYTEVKLGAADKFSRWAFKNYMIFKSPRGGQKLDYQANELPSLQTVPIPNIPPENIYITRNLSYLELLPLMAYKFTPSLSAAIGPMFAYCIKGTDEYKYTSPNGGDYSYSYKIRDDIQPFDCGYAIDIEWRLMHGKGLRLNARLAQSFTDIYKNSSIKGSNIYFQLGCGIQIGGKTKVSSAPNVFENTNNKKK